MVGGCGDDDGDATTTSAAPSTSTVALADWRDVVDAGCKDWNERFAHLEGAEPSTPEEALRHTAEVHELATGLAEVLAEAGVPDDERDDARRLVELTGDVQDAAGDLAASAAAGDGGGIDDATERIEDLGEQINPLAEGLGVPACGGY